MHELLTTHEMAEADRITIHSGVPGIALMERAGAAVADAAAAMAPVGAAIAVVCGPGNNGGDGFVAARLLRERGHTVRLMLIGQRDALRGDAALAADAWDGTVEPADPARLAGAGLMVDAIFGAGLARPVDGLPRAMIKAMNANAAPVLAVDLPSGINGDSGQVMGGEIGAAVEAAATVTFFRKKPGHLLLPGRLHCGPVTVADIGIGADVLDGIAPKTFANVPALWAGLFPVPQVDGHKYRRGHAVVVSGGLASTGAARLAARAALRGGAGLVTIASPAEALAINAANSLAVMVRPVDGAGALSAMLADTRYNAVVLGPGGGVGRAMRQMVAAASGEGRGLVLDADALTSFAGRLPELAALLRGCGQATVLTPHEGEFARLFVNVRQDADIKSKLKRARLAAMAVGAIVLLKGPDTVVAAPDGRAAIAENAPPWLATAGSGDVLAGIIGGLLAEGMPGFEAASAAVWLHGETANRLGIGMVSEDLTEALPALLRDLLRSGTIAAG